jgi:tRNA(Ile)-lysidine synthase
MAIQAAKSLRPVLLKHLVQTARQQQLFEPGQHLLVGVSGGPDSTAMLALLVRLTPSWRLTLTAVHVNYGFRGAESDGDEAFVADMCRDWGIPLVIRRPALAKRRGQSSIQALARDVRYALMKDVAREVGADRIVVGHTADDQAETILMWMMRGSGLSGLAGMSFVREGMIVRPLLSSTRREILGFLDQEGLRFRRDSSNDSCRYLRNRIRGELIPVINRLAPAALRALQSQANLLRADDEYLEQIVEEHWRSVVIHEEEGRSRVDRKTLSLLPVALQRRVIRRLLRLYDPEGRAAGARLVEGVRRLLCSGSSEACLALRRVTIRRVGRWLQLAPSPLNRVVSGGKASPIVIAVSMAIPSTVKWGGTGRRIQVQVVNRRHADFLMKRRSPLRAVFDSDLVEGPLTVRNWQAGDRFYPSGMGGKQKKLQDLFTDLKIAGSRRMEVPVLSCSAGILWVAGIRQDDRFLARPSTQRYLVVTMSEDTPEEGAR